MAWEITGNSGTHATNNFLGTTDSQPFVIKTNGVEALRIQPGSRGVAGKVGIGTAATPDTMLEIASDGDATNALLLRSTNAAIPRSFRIGPGVGAVGIFGIHDDNAAATRLAIDYAGNVGIGTNAPTARLEIVGDLRVSGDIFLEGADCAEEFEINSVEDIPAGTVMVIEDPNTLRPCDRPYDPRVAGVVSGGPGFRPAIRLNYRRDGKTNRVPVALMGRVACRVDADAAPISPGDLLATSDTPGHAMKVRDPGRALGTILGKAMAPLSAGLGLIPVLVALH